MPNQEEIERALRELFQDIHTVPATLPPVYTCGDFLIGFDRQGQIKVTGSLKTEPEPSPIEPHWLKRWQERLWPSLRVSEIGQRVPVSWLKRCLTGRGRWIKLTEVQ